jgi:hypothetical protein
VDKDTIIPVGDESLRSSRLSRQKIAVVETGSAALVYAMEPSPSFGFYISYNVAGPANRKVTE